ncbi:LysR family transcriptional regulator [Nocardia beijingensis]|uniref:LysR family transcriptional regulator n=1 Tax=Nocardia beijingensis TaxID=95162 RepID=UPI00344F2A97
MTGIISNDVTGRAYGAPYTTRAGSGVDLALEALLTEQSVTRAAERMSVGQTAMSASLARLRRHFNDPLLVRHGRSLALSPLGESLLEAVRSAVAAAGAVLERTSEFDPSTDRRTFTHQCPPRRGVDISWREPSTAVTTIMTPPPAGGWSRTGGPRARSCGPRRVRRHRGARTA